ncbi:MAG: VWA domain-containing protein, partial [Candidatus Binatia bacterium]
MKFKKMDQKGQVLIFVSLAFILLGLMAGLGIDLGRGYLMKAQLMRTADAAALAGAKALKGQADFEDEAIVAACDAAEMNGLTCGQGNGFDVSVSFVDKDVEGGPPMRFIEISASAAIPTTLLRLLNLVSVGDFSTLGVSAFSQGGPERPVDLMFVLDRSGSMTATDGTGTTKINALKTAVNEFLDNSFSPDDRLGMVSFATRGCGDGTGTDITGSNCSPDKPLGTSIASLKAAVNTLIADGGTNTMEALLTGGNEINSAFTAPGRERSRKALLLVT